MLATRIARNSIITIIVYSFSLPLETAMLSQHYYRYFAEISIVAVSMATLYLFSAHSIERQLSDAAVVNVVVVVVISTTTT